MGISKGARAEDPPTGWSCAPQNEHLQACLAFIATGGGVGACPGWLCHTWGMCGHRWPLSFNRGGASGRGHGRGHGQASKEVAAEIDAELMPELMVELMPW